jgi:hypothetical protein
VHQIEFTGGALRHDQQATFPVFYESQGETFGLTAVGFQTQIAVDVLLHVGTMEDVLAHPNGTPQSVQSPPVTAVANLDYFVTGTSQCHLPGADWGFYAQKGMAEE